ncbi:PCMT1 [Cordylochernes scorpioides]|uniref:protein-L-isoaspartate(D-aspartate) O-methyltransferase n=1 Tax=Cordylochernes scorpioides TaxID=51811 RepID=A0ABY6KMS2_9ARAC|nr:PCMT1 [Cordylochernes scorpioides]
MAWVFHVRSSNQDMVEALRRRGIVRCSRVDAALRSVDRRFYCPSRSYEDAEQPLGIGDTTVPAPRTVALELEMLSEVCFPGARVLDIACGSGYVTSLLAGLVGDRGLVVGLDSDHVLVEHAARNIRTEHPGLLESGSVKVLCPAAPLSEGFPYYAPYNAIHVGAAVPDHAPAELLQQLIPGGRLVLAVDYGAQGQFLETLDRGTAGAVERRVLATCSRPLLAGLCA